MFSSDSNFFYCYILPASLLNHIKEGNSIDDHPILKSIDLDKMASDNNPVLIQFHLDWFITFTPASDTDVSDFPLSLRGQKGRSSNSTWRNSLTQTPDNCRKMEQWLSANSTLDQGKYQVNNE